MPLKNHLYIDIEQCHVVDFHQKRLIPVMVPNDWGLQEEDTISWRFGNLEGFAKVVSVRPFGASQTLCNIQKQF